MVSSTAALLCCVRARARDCYKTTHEWPKTNILGGVLDVGDLGLEVVEVEGFPIELDFLFDFTGHG